MKNDLLHAMERIIYGKYGKGGTREDGIISAEGFEFTKGSNNKAHELTLIFDKDNYRKISEVKDKKGGKSREIQITDSDGKNPEIILSKATSSYSNLIYEPTITFEKSWVYFRPDEKCLKITLQLKAYFNEGREELEESLDTEITLRNYYEEN
ncbi:MAG: hypothetical protein ACMUJM_12010 [bacterium]